MDAALVPYSSLDQSVSPYKQIKTPRKSARAFISKPSKNLSPTNVHGGLLLHHHPPPPLSASIFFSHSFQPHHQQQQQQPPLLPLPTPIAHQYSLPSRTRKPNNKRREQSLTPKKSKPTKREDPNKQDLAPSTRRAVSECLMVASTKPLGPDPNDLPKDVSRVFSSTAAGDKSFGKVLAIEELEMFSGTVFSLAPPPSSLPLPKFSLRPKLCCNAEAAGIDAGATDNLRRMLRLR
ncbi:uncharacterized protein LOC132191058 [Corylus avellana]|uniref:uncharacterized protein LOC132189730 n=1 Tax=Corylus avellana TaxID=13451 RepID=UPI00286D5F0A|nr:uncharacterized protein LOC132189730 [Corylus avellana]XP_059462060.1 uncharacterized protein LOC132191058 [Corylus avellana]